MNAITKSKKVALIVAGIFLLQQCLIPMPSALAHDGLHLDTSLTDTTDPFAITFDESTTTTLDADSPLSAPSTSTEGPQAAPTSGKGGGKPGSDSTAPVISAISVTNISISGATVSWTTDDSSDSTVRSGLSSTNLTSTTSSGTRVTSHTLSLANLAANTVYYYCVSSRNRAGLVTESAMFSFTTTADTTAPAISSVTSTNITETGATITWTSNEPADTRVEYGTTTSYGQSTALNSNLVTNHSQTLTGLAANAIYHYRVISRDASGNISVSGDFTFQTRASTSTGPVTIFLNFLGAFIPQWGSYSNLSLAAFAGAGSEIPLILSGVAEKFSIFNTIVTTVDPFVRTQTYANPTEEANAKYNYYTQNRIMEAVITNSGPEVIGYSSGGGYAYYDSFTNSIVNSVLIFASRLSNLAKYIWEAVAHELGHAFGLQHQNAYDGNGNWTYNGYTLPAGSPAPIMGYSYDRRGQWWYGATSSSTTYQDDIAVISRSQNGFGLRADEAGSTTNTAAVFSNLSGTSVSTSGRITSSTDQDYYQFTTLTDGAVSFSASVAAYAAMLNLVLEIRRADGTIVVSRDTTSLGESILNYFLTAGTYYLVVRSKGLYGDVGQYSISGTVPLGTTTTAGGPASASMLTSSTTTTSSSSTSPSGASTVGSTSEIGQIPVTPSWSMTGASHYQTMLTNRMERQAETQSTSRKKEEPSSTARELISGTEGVRGIDNAISHVPANHGQANAVLSEVKESLSEGEAPGLTFGALLRDPSLHPVLAKYLM